jgi:hypothetical protein
MNLTARPSGFLPLHRFVRQLLVGLIALSGNRVARHSREAGGTWGSDAEGRSTGNRGVSALAAIDSFPGGDGAVGKAAEVNLSLEEIIPARRSCPVRPTDLVSWCFTELHVRPKKRSAVADSGGTQRAAKPSKTFRGCRKIVTRCSICYLIVIN